jgi:hypothetical protein
MESSSNKVSLENHMKNQEDWYRALIFDKNCTTIASKNVTKVDKAELR